MRKILFIILLVFIPGIAYGSMASDFIVNRQSTYAVPRDVTKVLVLDLTLPEPSGRGTLKVESIKLHNAGTATHVDISKLMIWEDGPSAGWDNDETEVAKVLTAPFFDTEISGAFREYSKGDSWQRIFVTLDTTSATLLLTERTIKPELEVGAVIFSETAFNGPTDTNVIGFERTIAYNASIPTTPLSPSAGTPEAISASTIRWHFTDSSNNEFGFKILDAESNIVAREEKANLSYLDETGLQPGTEYSGRKVVAFNDKGESLGSGLSVFSATRTLAEEIEPAESPEDIQAGKEEVVEGEEVVKEEEGGTGEPFSIEEIRAKIIELQEKLVGLLQQLIELLQQQTATIWIGFWQFLQSFFGK